MNNEHKEPILEEPVDPDFTEENEGLSVFRKIFNALVIFLTVFGFLYIYVFQDFFTFRKTSQSVEETRVESVFNLEKLSVELVVYIVESDGDFGSSRTIDDVERLVLNSNKIWEQADITLNVKEIFFFRAEDSEISNFLNEPSLIIKKVEPPGQGEINIFLVRSLGGINGISFGGIKTVAVADYTTVYDFRVLAHELGHVLRLVHIPNDRAQLMFQGANGVELSDQDIVEARKWIGKL